MQLNNIYIMKVAYYEENNYHTEILGVFLYYCQMNTINMIVYNDSDKSEYIDYYKKIHNFELKKIDEIKKEYDEYDYIILGTSYSVDRIKDIYSKIYSKMIPVCHLKENIVSDQQCIILTPLNVKNASCNYILPIHNFNPDTSIQKKKNIFTLVGRFKDNNRDTDDLINSLSKCNSQNYEVHLYARHVKFIPKRIFEYSTQNPSKLKIFLKTKTAILEKRIKESKFLLTLVSKNSYYHNDRLSGVIPLAFNYNVPLIMDKNLNNIYGFSSCLTYDNSLSEILEYAIEMSEDVYNSKIKDVMCEKNIIVNKNNITLSKMLK